MIAIISYGQKNEVDGYINELKKYEVTEQEVPFFGMQKIIMGTFIVKKGKKKVATHDFIIPIMNGNISHIAVLDSKGNKIFPRLHYLVEEKAYTFYEGTDKEGKEKALKSNNQKEIVLSGLMIWTKLKY